MRTRNLWDFPEVVERMSEDLFKDLDRYPPEVYRKFFVARDSEARDLANRIVDAEGVGTTVFIVGDPGVGKTSFIQWFLRSRQYSHKVQDRHLLLELRPSAGIDPREEFLSHVRETIVDGVMQYMKDFEGDLSNDIDQLRSENRERAAFNKACSVILESRKDKKPLVLFVDDIDYVDERYLSNLIAHLEKFISSDRCVTIIAVRKPAYNAVRAAKDCPVSAIVGREIRDIRLSHLPVEEVLKARVDLICSDDQCELGAVLRRRKTVLGKFAILQKALRMTVGRGKPSSRRPPEPQDDFIVTTIKNPYTYKQYAFMQDVSNGNVRHMLEMAKEILKYMVRNKKRIREEEQGYWIGRPAIMEIFTRSDFWGRTRVRNVHELKSHAGISKARVQEIGQRKVGNSLCVVLMEMLHDGMQINSMSLESLTEYGFTTKEQIKTGIAALIDMEMIEQREISDTTALGGVPTVFDREYYLTLRGDYYVNYMIHWKEYIEVYRRSKHHLLGGGPRTMRSLQYMLLDFTVKLFLTMEKVLNLRTDFKVKKINFYRSFCDLYKESLEQTYHAQLDEEFPLTEHTVTDVLVKLGLVREFEIEESVEYVFLRDSTFRIAEKHKVCEQRGRKWKVKPPHPNTILSEIVRKYLRPPEYETRKKDGKEGKITDVRHN